MADDDVLDVGGNDLRNELREKVKSMFTPRQVDVEDYLAADEFLLMEGGRMAVKLCMVKGQPQLVFGDAQGTNRLQIGLSDNGEPVIKLSDAQGQLRAALCVADYGPTISLSDEKGRTRVSIGVDMNDGPALSIRDANGRVRGALLLRDETPHLVIWDAREKPLFHAP